MFTSLLKIQLKDAFSGYFYNERRGKNRTKAGIVTMFILYAVIMVILLGGVFFILSAKLCDGMVQASAGWLYFAILSLASFLVGAFGSAVCVYKNLFDYEKQEFALASKKEAICAKAISLYLLSFAYSAVVIIPATVVYWIVCGTTPARVVCGIALMFILSAASAVFACFISMAMKWTSKKIENQWVVRFFISLIFFAAYYFCYFIAGNFVQNTIANAAANAEKIIHSAWIIYFFGSVGEGNTIATIVFFALTVLLLVFAVISFSKVYDNENRNIA